jgi:hypothetical protein
MAWGISSEGNPQDDADNPGQPSVPPVPSVPPTYFTPYIMGATWQGRLGRSPSTVTHYLVAYLWFQAVVLVLGHRGCGSWSLVIFQVTDGEIVYVTVFTTSLGVSHREEIT